MRSRDPRDYTIKIQYSLYKEYDDAGFIAEDIEGPNKTFWLESTDGEFSRRYSVESAPEWVLQIFEKIIGNAITLKG